MDTITIYKVIIPNWCVWPGLITLKICMTREAAEKYINEYPNPFLKSYLFIEEENVLTWESD